MESYSTEEEQVEALKRWWDENGRSTIVAIVIALAAGFGWQGWKSQQEGQAEAASDMYQALLRTITASEISNDQQQSAIDIAERIKVSFSDSTYAEFAALHLARMAVEAEDLSEAEVQLRWVLGHADAGSDSAQLAQLRLGRVVAASGDTEQALAILSQGGDAYRASYAIARGDTLLAAGKREEAREAYLSAEALAAAQGGPQLSILQAKLQSLTALASSGIQEMEEPTAANSTEDSVEDGAEDAMPEPVASDAAAEGE